MKNLLKEIGINEVGYYSKDNNYVIDLENSDHFNKVFSKLQKSDKVEENEDSSVINLNVSNVLFVSDSYAFNIIADFDQDLYKLVITELEGDNNDE
jgi:phosphoribosylaminoimidazole (AIR) synthetase